MARLRLRTGSRTQRRELVEKAMQACFMLNGTVAILALAGILIFLLKESLPALVELGPGATILGTRWNPTSMNPGYGMLPLIVSTIMVTVGALIIAVPWGIATAAYISEVATVRLKEMLKPAVEMLAIFPSVIFGFIGLVVVAPAVARVFGMTNGQVALTGSITLAIMALPTIVSVAEDAITGISRDYREAAYALGATRWQAVRMVVLPAARSGITAAVMLAFGRAVGETMAVLMTTGDATGMPLTEVLGFITGPDFLASVRTLTANIAQEGLNVPWGSLHWQALFLCGLILFILTFAVNLTADLVMHRPAGGRRRVS